MKKTISLFTELKGSRPITMLTAYDYSMARIVDAAGIDVILVGDSLGMVFQGNDNTLTVTVDDMIYHTRAVKRGIQNAFCVTDMPWMSYHVSPSDAVLNAGRLIKEGGAEAVKVEGGHEIIPAIEAIRVAKIPVIGHLGLTPQSVNDFGGFKVQAKSIEQARKLVHDALMLEEAGVTAIVLECIPEQLGRLVTDKLSIPTIGIGAGRYVDGQVLVVHDLTGMFADFNPKFARRFCNGGEVLTDGIRQYVQSVYDRAFPAEEHSFTMDNNVFEQLAKEFS